jgi:hypothetical protein
MDYHDFEDLRSVVALHEDYSVAEPFVEGAHDVRILFVAPDYYRAQKRPSSKWSSAGDVECADAEVTPHYKSWCDEIRAAFGGLDIFAVDVIVGADGSEFIRGVRGSDVPFATGRERQDCVHVREMIAARLREAVGRVIDEGSSDVEVACAEVPLINLRNRVEQLEIENREFAEVMSRQKKQLQLARERLEMWKGKGLLGGCAILGCALLMWWILKGGAH